jgi:hypothetical protein
MERRGALALFGVAAIAAVLPGMSDPPGITVRYSFTDPRFDRFWDELHARCSKKYPDWNPFGKRYWGPADQRVWSETGQIRAEANERAWLQTGSDVDELIAAIHRRKACLANKMHSLSQQVKT